MPDQDVWKTGEASKLFLNEVRGGIPLAAEQLGILSRLVAAARPALRDFLDLGCGNAILGRALLRRFPQAQGVFLDFSTPMLQAARAELPGAHGHRFVQADLSVSSWCEQLGSGAFFDAVVSGFAIHHLTDARKRELYAEIQRLLRPGGIFLNLEHVSSPTPWLAEVNDELFVDSLYSYQLSKGCNPTRAELSAMYRERKDRQANILAPVETQCAWLRELGFQHVDCYFKVFELALFGGVKREA